MKTDADLHSRKQEAERRLKEARQHIGELTRELTRWEAEYKREWYALDALNRQLERQTVGQEE